MNWEKWVDEKIITEENITRVVKYYWLVSTLRLMLGVSILLLMLLGGYKFGDLIPK